VGKPSASATEVEWIAEANPADVEIAYNDIIRCVRRAAGTEEIREAEVLCDILLSVAAPAQAKLHRGTSTQELQLLCRTILGERSKIFNIVLEDNMVVIGLESRILEVKGFPIRIKKEDNIGDVVTKALKLHENS